MAGANRTETFDVDCEKLFDVIVNYASYPDFVEGASSVEVLEQDENGARVEYSIKIVKKFKYILKMAHERPNKVSWVLEGGDIFKSNNGSWVLEDLGEGRTKATYSIDVDLKVFAPKKILDTLVNTNLPSMMKAFASRA